MTDTDRQRLAQLKRILSAREMALLMRLHDGGTQALLARRRGICQQNISRRKKQIMDTLKRNGITPVKPTKEMRHRERYFADMDKLIRGGNGTYRLCPVGE